MIYIRHQSMLVSGKSIPIITLTAETELAVYDIRLWPNGMAQRVRNHLVLIKPTELKRMWVTKPCRDLDRAQCVVRQDAIAFLGMDGSNCTDTCVIPSPTGRFCYNIGINCQRAQAKRDAWWRLRKLVDGFNETTSAGQPALGR